MGKAAREKHRHERRLRAVEDEAPVTGRDLLEDLRELVAEMSLMNDLLDAGIVLAREDGCTWAEIAESVGMTSMGALKRYRRTVGVS